MVDCKCVQVRTVSTCGCYWSSIEAMFHKVERCRQNFIGQAAFPQDRVKNVFETTDSAFPNTSMVGALGGLNFHLFRFFKSASLRTCSFQLLILYMSSFSLATKFVPLSDQITDGVPRRAHNRAIPITQLLVSMLGTTTKWTARVVRQVKRKPHLFSVNRLTDTKKGPK